MLLNNYSRPTPYPLPNRQRTDLNIRQSPMQGEPHLIEQPLVQPLTLPLLNGYEPFAAAQPLLCHKQVNQEGYQVIPPFFGNLNTNSVAQSSIQTNSGSAFSHFPDACAAINYNFPNQFTWSPPSSFDSGLATGNIFPSGVPLAEEGHNVPPNQPLNNPVGLAAQPLLNPANWVTPQAPASAPKHLHENRFYAPPPTYKTEKAIIPATTITPDPLPSAPISDKAQAQQCPPKRHPIPILPRLPGGQTNEGALYRTYQSLPIAPSAGKTSARRTAQLYAAQKACRERQRHRTSHLEAQSKELEELRKGLVQFSNQLEQFKLPQKLATSRMTKSKIFGILKLEILEMLKQSIKLNEKSVK